MKDFLENIVKQMVEQPEEVVITQSQDEERTTFNIKVADSDMGRIIGKNGKVINAIRMIMRVMAIRQDVRIRIDIEDNQRLDEVPNPTELEDVETQASPEDGSAVEADSGSVDALVGQPE